MKRAERPLFRVSLFLPLLVLSISWTLLVMGDPQIFHQISASLNHADLTLTPPPVPRLPPELLQEHPTWDLSVFKLIWCANLPGFWLEFIDSVRTWPYSWSPSAFPLFDVWRAFTFPLAATIFWSWVGSGVDYFLGRHTGTKIQVSWLAFAGSLVAFLFAAIIAVAGLVNDDPDLHPPAFNHTLIAIGMLWMVLSAICCAAWIHQVRTRRKERSSQQSAAAAQPKFPSVS